MTVSCDTTRQNGLALIIVLWVTASLALIVAGFNVNIRSGISLASSDIETSKRIVLSDAALEITAQWLLLKDPKKDDPLTENAPKRWRVDATPYDIDFAGHKLTIAVSDINARFDLNKSDPEILKRFFARFVADENRAAALSDYIVSQRGSAVRSKAPNEENKPKQDPGEASKTAAPGPGIPNPRQKTKTRRNGNPDRARNAPDTPPKPYLHGLIDVSDLRRAPDMTAPLFRKLAPFLTVHGATGLINPMTAPREVMAALPGITAFDLDEAIDTRRKDRKDAAAVMKILEKAKKWLQPNDGPAYIVNVAVADAAKKRTLATTSTLLLNADPKAPFRVLSRRIGR